jgi:uncharacterized protein (DUF885 family)
MMLTPVLWSAARLGVATAVVSLSGAPGPVLARQTAPATLPGAGEPSDAARAFRALLREHYQWLLAGDPLTASRLGDRRFNRLLRDESPAAYERRRGEMADQLARLSGIDVLRLDETDRLNADLLRYELETAIEEATYFPEQMPLDARSGPQIWLPQLADVVPLATSADFDDVAARLEAIPTQIDQIIAQMRAGVAAGRLPPKVVLNGVVEQARALADPRVIEAPTTSPFYGAFRGRVIGGPGGPTQESADRAAKAIREGVAPAFGRLAEFLEREYIPAARESVAASDGAGGRAWYDLQLRRHTTTRLTAQEIHDIGLAEVARIKAEMLAVIATTDFPRKTELSGEELFRAFVADLRTNPRFYFTDAEALLAGYRDIAKRIDAELPLLFGKLPRTPYGVREMPPLAAKSSPTAYYYPGSLKSGLAGYFVANTYRLDQRPRYEMTALTLHEAVPGHHLQGMIAAELADEAPGLDPFRALLGYSAYVEGWALYAERLGMEIGGPSPREDDAQTGRGSGLYADPYDNFGRLTYEMWRANRLVVDTGIHAFGWSRQRAIDFMLANTALSELNIEREVDRYIAWPGQATAYKIGELAIRRMRADAEKALGKAFDLRAFHDELLGAGALPLPVLEARMQRWVQARASGQ